MASKDGQYGYEMEVITFPGSGVTKMEDIKGKKMAFTSQTSNSGYRAPSPRHTAGSVSITILRSSQSDQFSM